MHSKLLTFGLILSAPLILAGCDTIPIPELSVAPIKEETILSRTSSLSNVYVMEKKSGYIVCSEPPPDSAFEHSDNSNLSFSLIRMGSGDQGSQADVDAEEELLGRTPAVLLSRELFFRACEFSRNYDLDKAEALSLFRETLAMVSRGWGVEGQNTKVTINESELNTVQQKFLENLSKNPSAISSPTASAYSYPPYNPPLAPHVRPFPYAHPSQPLPHPGAPVIRSTPKPVAPSQPPSRGKAIAPQSF